MVQQKYFVKGPPYPGGGDRPSLATYTVRADLMRRFFYRKVVLSDSAAMMVTGTRFGVPAFATAGGGAWKMAPSRDGIEDAINHNGKFHSITYAGAVEVWEQDADADDVFRSAVIAPKLLPLPADADHRKYLVVAPDGRLMVVLEDSKETWDVCCRRRRACSFKVYVLVGEQWKETDDIGESVLFVGVNGSLCVSTMQHPELRAGCVYYTENDVGLCNDLHKHEQSGIGVYSLKDGTVEKVEGLGRHRSWPPPAWFIPFIP
uniref:KIB1-4 beta-propeller domain-containing protein n=1 Tax=Hordeum vulgare subsp. vulgare TaxID=112509 RepID=A0A8I6XIR8_HORVV